MVNPLLPAGVLADLKGIVHRAIPAQATIVRAGVTIATLPCRVDDETRELRMHGLPTWLRLQQWSIQFETTADVKIQDLITVGGITYVALAVERDTTWSASNIAIGPRITYSATSRLPIPPNAQVTFSNPRAPANTPPITADVYLYPADDDVRLYGLEPALKHAVLFDPALADSTSTLIGKGWEIRTTILGKKSDGSARVSTITPPRRTLGALPIATAYFAEPL